MSKGFTIKFSVNALFASLLLGLLLGMLPAIALANQGASLVAGTKATVDCSQASCSSAELRSQATRSSYWVKTKDYRFKIPKYWRGKVTWKTTSSKSVGRARCYCTKIYLKGHKGDERYQLASVMSGGFTGLNSGYDVIFYKKTKIQDCYPVNRSVVMWSRNMPYCIWCGVYESYGYPGVSIKDQKMMLKLATFNKVSYAKASRNADYGTTAYKAVKKYQKKYFKSSFRVLR